MEQFSAFDQVQQNLEQEESSSERVENIGASTPEGEGYKDDYTYLLERGGTAEQVAELKSYNAKILEDFWKQQALREQIEKIKQENPESIRIEVYELAIEGIEKRINDLIQKAGELREAVHLAHDNRIRAQLLTKNPHYWANNRTLNI